MEVMDYKIKYTNDFDVKKLEGFLKVHVIDNNPALNEAIVRMEIGRLDIVLATFQELELIKEIENE